MYLPWEPEYYDYDGQYEESEAFDVLDSDFDTISYNVSIVHQTEKAYLLNMVGQGNFWVPKRLCVVQDGIALIDECFKIKFIKESSIDRIEGAEIEL